jgi:hypothetical protein
MSQVMNLVHLAPDIQEAILFLPRTQRGRDPVKLAQLQAVARVSDWSEQRRLWRNPFAGPLLLTPTQTTGDNAPLQS